MGGTPTVMFCNPPLPASPLGGRESRATRGTVDLSVRTPNAKGSASTPRFVIPRGSRNAIPVALRSASGAGACRRAFGSPCGLLNLDDSSLNDRRNRDVGHRGLRRNASLGVYLTQPVPELRSAAPFSRRMRRALRLIRLFMRYQRLTPRIASPSPDGEAVGESPRGAMQRSGRHAAPVGRQVSRAAASPHRGLVPIRVRRGPRDAHVRHDPAITTTGAQFLQLCIEIVCANALGSGFCPSSARGLLHERHRAAAASSEQPSPPSAHFTTGHRRRAWPSVAAMLPCRLHARSALASRYSFCASMRRACMWPPRLASAAGHRSMSWRAQATTPMPRARPSR